MTDKDALLKDVLQFFSSSDNYTQPEADYMRDELVSRITAALAEKDDGGKVWVGYAQGMPNGKLHFMETNCDPADIHDTGKPLYKVYRDARPLPPLPKGDE